MSFAFFKKYWVNTVLIGFVLIVLLVPGVKPWILGRLISIGVFNVEIKNSESPGKSTIGSFAVTSDRGETFDVPDLKGKVVFINFWASWCPPCVAEMPSIYKLYQRFKGNKEMVFIFINEDDDKRKALKYLEQNNFSIPLQSRAGAISPEWYNGTLPTTLVINKAGEVVLNHAGIGSYNSDKFIKSLEILAGEVSHP